MIVGIDEVGRGCWAGPLVAGAVLLQTEIPGLKDSKKLSKLQRERLAAAVYDSDAVVGIGWVTPAEVDQMGLTIAVRTAMERALVQITVEYEEVIIDGNLNFLAHLPKTRELIKADDLVPAVSAASIVAKVARDNYMAELAKLYPGYGFEKHVGYGTALHLAGLQQLGISDMHRKSFKPIRALLQ
ncbi:MAG: putative Ribonuclease [Candidatus Saccharibacteria bacterium]|nr:putative Ribonuclease [Candidatus Saccharibacteria bacterium]